MNSKANFDNNNKTLTFTATAKNKSAEGKCNMVSVWTDGVALSSDNGSSKFMGGMSAHCAFPMTEGKRYRVTVEEVKPYFNVSMTKISSEILVRFDDKGNMELLAKYSEVDDSGKEDFFDELFARISEENQVKPTIVTLDAFEVYDLCKPEFPELCFDEMDFEQIATAAQKLGPEQLWSKEK